MGSRSAVLAVAVALSALACAGARGWERARAEDSPSAYHLFLREYPDSPHAAEARERLAFARVRLKPTVEAYNEVRADYPESPLLEEVAPLVEEHFFLRARASGSTEAYRAFLAEFPQGAFAARAAGNLEYLEQRGFDGRPSELAEFAARRGESDFAAEAQRSAAAVEARQRGAFRKVGFLLEIAGDTPGAERLARAFTERAHRSYRAAEIELVPLQDAGDPRGNGLPVRLEIRHAEGEVATEIESGQMASPGILATTVVTLNRAGEAGPIWSREFRFRASAAERLANDSILFGPAAHRYWSSFFVPVTSWSTQIAVRQPHPFTRPAVAVEAARERAVVLFNDGDFQIFDLGDPSASLLVGEYRRKRDLTRWSGLHLSGNGVILFGDDGVEVVAVGPEGMRRTALLAREAVGSIAAVESLGDDLVLASNRGLLLVEGGTGEPRTLLPRPILGLGRHGERLLITDGASVYVTGQAPQRLGVVEAELSIGWGFRPGRVRMRGSTALVFGDRGLLAVDLSTPTEPRVIYRVETTEVGTVRDATTLSGRLFLLGDRGLQLVDASRRRVVDSADVAARSRLAITGRHLVMVGEKRLQVVDATPFVAGAAAAPQPSIVDGDSAAPGTP